MQKEKLSDEATMKLLLGTLKDRLEELDDSRYNQDLFVQGEFCAYKDCLNMAMAWSKAKEIVGEVDDGFDVTKRRNGLRIIPNIVLPKKKITTNKK